MKKTASSKNKGAKSRSKRNLEINMEAARILRTVENQEAFYFYESLGKPTGEIARSLSEFLDKVKFVKSESIMFHLQRKDFENWVGKILGDIKLAEKLERISSANCDDVRTIVCRTIDNRIKELKESSIAILAAENLLVLAPSC
jgi:hypothetical protein